MTDPIQRQILLEHPVASHERGWYLRIDLDSNEGAYHQPHSPEFLNGLIEIAEVCQRERRHLVLANVGLFGWLMQAFGAVGISTGTGHRERAFTTERSGFAPPNQQAKPRYFEPALLHFMELASRDDVVAQDHFYVRCGCHYCALQRWHDPSQWDPGLALRHHVVLLASELARLDRSDCRSQVALRVAAARSYLERLSRKPTGDDRPRHLEAWDRVLS